MSKLPILLSVPHAGLDVPPEVARYSRLLAQDIAEDGDAGASTIYDLAGEVDGFVTTDVARAFVDLNRAEDDRRKDGVVKTHTCWNVPVYREPLPNDVIEALLERHHRPYHRRLSELGRSGRFRLAIDGHTMAANGPPVGPDPGAERPAVCLSNADGTCPESWVLSLARRFEDEFGDDVAINDPFRGGYIIRAHGPEMPWIQLELSRAALRTDREKRLAVLRALRAWCEDPR